MARKSADNLLDEADLIKSTERGEWASIGDIDARRAFWKAAAQGILDGKTPAYFHFNSGTRSCAPESQGSRRGMSYQTLINSILHKYLEE